MIVPAKYLCTPDWEAEHGIEGDLDDQDYETDSRASWERELDELGSFGGGDDDEDEEDEVASSEEF